MLELLAMYAAIALIVAGLMKAHAANKRFERDHSAS